MSPSTHSRRAHPRHRSCHRSCHRACHRACMLGSPPAITGILVCFFAAWLSPQVGRAAEPAATLPSGPRPGLPGGRPLIPGEDAEETYELNLVGIQHTEIGGYTTQRGYVMKSERWQGYRGKYKHMLGPIEFFDAVGRSDLHQRAVTRMTVGISLLVVGVGAAIGGGIYTVKHIGMGGPPPGPLLITGGGLVLGLVGSSLISNPVSEAEALKLARTYNDRLRAHLGLPPIIEDPTLPQAGRDVEPPKPATDRSPRRFCLVPALGDRAGGILLAGTF